MGGWLVGWVAVLYLSWVYLFCCDMLFVFRRVAHIIIGVYLLVVDHIWLVELFCVVCFCIVKTTLKIIVLIKKSW